MLAGKVFDVASASWRSLAIILRSGSVTVQWETPLFAYSASARSRTAQAVREWRCKPVNTCLLANGLAKSEQRRNLRRLRWLSSAGSNSDLVVKKPYL